VLGKRVDECRIGHGHDEHVTRMNRLPATNARSVETQSLVEELWSNFTDRNTEMLPRAREIVELQVDDLDSFFLDPVQYVFHVILLSELS
jgi:hypothetical protein